MALGKTSALKREIYDLLMNDIVEGVYRQSDMINEKQLVRKFGVSKSPVRDALIELCNEGVLLSHPRYGYEIVRINEREIRDIVDFRVIVEGECLRASAARISRRDREELKEDTLARYRKISEDFSVLKHWDNNTWFHLKLLSYSGNEYCSRVVEKSCGIMTRAYAQRIWETRVDGSLKIDCKSHLNVVDYLLEGNVEASVKELRADIRSFLDILYPNLGNLASPARWAGR